MHELRLMMADPERIDHVDLSGGVRRAAGLLYELCQSLSEALGNDRLALQVVSDFALEDELAHGTRVPETSDYVLHVEAVRNGPVFDFPWNASKVTIGTDHAREVIDRLFPGAAQFVPVKVVNPEPGDTTRFWAFNWLHVCDCLDYEASMVELSENEFFVASLRLIESRIPEDASIFRVKDAMTSVIVTEWARDRILESGVSGLDLDPEDQWY